MEAKEKDKQRAEVFDALGHPIRIRILETLNQGSMSFADLKRILSIESSGHLKHHIDKLNGLIKTDEYGKYCLSSEGKDALLGMKPIEKYNEDAQFREQIGLLINALHSDFSSVRGIAVVQLSLFGPRVVPYLTSILTTELDAVTKVKFNDHFYGEMARCSDYPSCSRKDEIERTIAEIIQTLGIINDPNTIEDIAKALPRSQAFEALAKIGNKRALGVVVSMMPAWFSACGESKDTDDFLRRVFGHFDEEDVRKELEAILLEGNEISKKTAARILGAVGDSKSFPALTDALVNGDASLITEVTSALHRLKDTEAVPKMISELFKNQNRNVSETIANAVLDLGSLENWLSVSFHRPKIAISTRPFEAAIIDSGEKAVPGLAKLLQDSNADVQREAAEMIAKIKRGEKYTGCASFSEVV